MDKLLAAIRSVLGASWFLKALGIVSTIGGIATVTSQAIATQGVPTDTAGVIGFVMVIMGMGQLGTKQVGVTNAKEANVVAQPIPAVPSHIETVIIPPVPKT